MLCTAIGTYLSLYPAMLLVPIYLLLLNAKAFEVRIEDYRSILLLILTSLPWYHSDTRAQAE